MASAGEALGFALWQKKKKKTLTKHFHGISRNKNLQNKGASMPVRKVSCAKQVLSVSAVVRGCLDWPLL